MPTLCEQEKITTSLPPIGSMGLVYFTLDGWLFFLVNVVSGHRQNTPTPQLMRVSMFKMYKKKQSIWPNYNISPT